jgi:hypothetical protein
MTPQRPRHAGKDQTVTLKRHLLAWGVLAALAAGTAAAGYGDYASIWISYSTQPRPLAEAGWGPVTHHLANTAFAISDTGTLMVWGLRAHGVPGNGLEFTPYNGFPTQVALPNDGRSPADPRRIVQLAAVGLDNDHSDLQHAGVAALSDEGYVYTWGGNNDSHMMGRPSIEPNDLYFRPDRVGIPDPVVDLTSTAGVFLALTTTGDLYTWGWAQGFGATGQGDDLNASSATPRRILTGVHSIGAGLWNGWAVRADQVYWWGRADAGWDPSGDGLGVTRGTPTVSATLSAYAHGCQGVGVRAGSGADGCSIRQLTGHAFGSQMLLADGSVLTWGDETHAGTGRVGSPNTPAPLALPVQVARIDDARDYVFLSGVDGYGYLFGWYARSYGPDPASGALSGKNLPVPTRFEALGRDWIGPGMHGNTGHVRLLDGRWASWGGSVGPPPANNMYLLVHSGDTTKPAGLTYWTPPAPSF